MYDSAHTCLKGGQRSFSSSCLSPGSAVDMTGKAGTAMVGVENPRTEDVGVKGQKDPGSLMISCPLLVFRPLLCEFKIKFILFKPHLEFSVCPSQTQL